MSRFQNPYVSASRKKFANERSLPKGGDRIRPKLKVSPLKISRFIRNCLQSGLQFLEAFLWEEKRGFVVVLSPLLPYLFFEEIKMENLDELRAAKAELEGKIQNEKSRHMEAFSKLKERMEIVDKAIFELDEGRTLEAARRAKTKGTGKRGRPSKNAANVSSNPVPIVASKSTAKK